MTLAYPVASRGIFNLDVLYQNVQEIDFHRPQGDLQVATVYVTTFCYLSLCEPMLAWVSPYLTVLVFVSTNQRASSQKA